MAVISLKNKLKSGSLLVNNEAYSPGQFYSIETYTVGSGGSSTITFSNIPSTYKHLQIRYMARDDRTGSSGDYLKITLNSDTNANYSSHMLYGNGSAAGATADTSVSNMAIGRIPTAGHTASVFGVGVLDLLDYADTNKYKTLRLLSGYDTNNTGTEPGYLPFNSGSWRSTSAVTTITIAPNVGTNFVQYSHFALYGVKG